MLLDFRCDGCGETFERVVARGDSSPRTCRCGGTAKRVYSPFNQKVYAVDRSNWAEIAPLDAEGRPMTMKEAAKVVDPYNPSEEARERAYQAQLREERSEKHFEQATREAWQEVSRRNRITVEG